MYDQTENCHCAKEQNFVRKGGTMYGGTITSGQLNILIWYKFNLQIIISIHFNDLYRCYYLQGLESDIESSAAVSIIGTKIM